jgi:hypothetical protein
MSANPKMLQVCAEFFPLDAARSCRPYNLPNARLLSLTMR